MRAAQARRMCIDHAVILRRCSATGRSCRSARRRLKRSSSVRSEPLLSWMFLLSVQPLLRLCSRSDSRRRCRRSTDVLTWRSGHLRVSSPVSAHQIIWTARSHLYHTLCEYCANNNATSHFLLEKLLQQRQLPASILKSMELTIGTAVFTHDVDCYEVFYRSACLRVHLSLLAYAAVRCSGFLSACRVQTVVFTISPGRAGTTPHETVRV